MPRYKAVCGEMEEIVEADSHEEAAANLFTMFDDIDEVPEIGVYVSTIEVVGEELWHKADDAIKRAGRWGIPTDANIAERSSTGSPTSSG